MKKQNKIFYGFLVLLTLLMSFSCKKDENTPDNPDDGLVNGFYIVNEGPFLNGIGTVDFVKNSGMVFTDIYAAANNGMALGSVVQSVEIIGDRTYIVVNNSNKIEVVETATFQRLGTIGAVMSPRYILGTGDGKALISCIQDSSVKVADLGTFAVTASLPVKGPEKMMRVGNSVWVLCQGGFSVDSAIVVIDIPTKSISDTIPVYPQPSGIQEDMDGNIWVMCSGRNAWHPGSDSKGHLICLDPSDFTVLRDLEFPVAENHPEELEISANGDVMFYRYPGGICRCDIVAVQPETEPFIQRANGFYTLAVDKTNGWIIGTDPLNFTQNGWVFRYNSQTGAVIDSVEAGIIPGQIYFVP